MLKPLALAGMILLTPATAEASGCLKLTGSRARVDKYNHLDGRVDYTVRGTEARTVTSTSDTYRAGVREYHDVARSVELGPTDVLASEQFPLSWKGETLTIRFVLKASCGKIVVVRRVKTRTNPLP